MYLSSYKALYSMSICPYNNRPDNEFKMNDEMNIKNDNIYIIILL